jgi:hypothetical protein
VPLAKKQETLQICLNCDGWFSYSTWDGEPVLVNRSKWADCSAKPKARRADKTQAWKILFRQVVEII